MGNDWNRRCKGHKLFRKGGNRSMMVVQLWVTLYLNEDIDGA